jgi:hypothetical protein
MPTSRAPYDSAIAFENLSIPDEQRNELRHCVYLHEARQPRAAIGNVLESARLSSAAVAEIGDAHRT